MYHILTTRLKCSQHIFSNTINFGLFRNIGDKVSHPLKTDNSIVLYFVIILFVNDFNYCFNTQSLLLESVYDYMYLYLCSTPFSHYSGYRALTQMAALCSKLCHREVKNKQFTILFKKGGNEVNV